MRSGSMPSPVAQAGRRLIVARSWDPDRLATWLLSKRVTPVAFLVCGHSLFESVAFKTWLRQAQVPTVVWTCAGDENPLAWVQVHRVNHAIVLDTQWLHTESWCCATEVADVALCAPQERMLK